MMDCDPKWAWTYYQQVSDNSIYCNHPEIEYSVTIRKEHPIFDREDLAFSSKKENVERVTLSLLTKKQNIGKHSGLNWGQREVVPEKLRTLDHGRPWSDDQFASTRLSSNRDMSR